MVTLSQFSCFITPLKPFLFAGFCPIASVSNLKIEVNFNREYIYIYFSECPVLPSSISHGFVNGSCSLEGNQ